MQKVPFTNDGVQLKQQQLYALSEPDFDHEMQQVRNHCADWLIDNFIFNQDQIDYVEAIPPDTISWMGEQFSEGFIDRARFTLEPPPGPFQPPLAARRGVKVTVKAEASWSPPNDPYIKKLEVGVGFTIP